MAEHYCLSPFTVKPTLLCDFACTAKLVASSCPMPENLLDRLDAWKSDFGSNHTGDLERLLEAVAARRFPTPADLIRLHETLLFLRAYPRSRRVARLADQVLACFADRVAGFDPDAFAAPEISGIAGTSLTG